MRLLIDENGNVVVRNGKPVYVKDDGSEVEFDVASTQATITRLQGESRGHREGKEAAIAAAKTRDEEFKVFEGLDPEAARKALDTLSKIDQSKLIDGGEVDKVRAAVAKEYETRLAAQTTVHTTELGRMKADNETLIGQLHSEVIGGGFARSKMIAEKLAIPADLVQAKFGSAFKVVDGKLQAVDASGNTIYSPARPGEPADLDEALDHLVNNYANRDQILKPSGASGSGASGSAGRGNSNTKGISRDAFEALSPMAKRAHIQSGNAISD